VKYLLRYSMQGGVDMANVHRLFPAHRARWTEYQQRGTLLAIGPFANPRDGALAVFSNRADAEEFARRDPFVTEGVVAEWTISEWNEVLLTTPEERGSQS
jgi:uncharacterized protein YciI